GSRGVVLRGQTKGLAVAEIHRSEFRLADSHCVFQQGPVHRPKVPRRTGDDAQHLRSRCLSLQRLVALTDELSKVGLCFVVCRGGIAWTASLWRYGLAAAGFSLFEDRPGAPFHWLALAQQSTS